MGSPEVKSIPTHESFKQILLLSSILQMMGIPMEAFNTSQADQNHLRNNWEPVGK